jgi:hypothetical protein
MLAAVPREGAPRVRSIAAPDVHEATARLDARAGACSSSPSA